MKTKMFGIYDTKALNYGAPFFMPTVGAAVRAFTDLANDEKSTVNKHPSDYMLMELGEFDDQSGKTHSLEAPKNLGFASDYIDQARPAAPVEQFTFPMNGKEVVVNREDK